MKNLIQLFCFFCLSVLHGQDTLTYPIFETFVPNDGEGLGIYLQEDSTYIITGRLHDSGSNGGSTVSKYSKNDSLLWRNIYDTWNANRPAFVEEHSNSDLFIPISDVGFLPTGGISSGNILARYEVVQFIGTLC